MRRAFFNDTARYGFGGFAGGGGGAPGLPVLPPVLPGLPPRFPPRPGRGLLPGRLPVPGALIPGRGRGGAGASREDAAGSALFTRNDQVSAVLLPRQSAAV